MSLRTLPFWLVDVFAREPLSGNGLSIFLLDDELPASAMQRITQEMRQFETIFLQRRGESTFDARIFTMEEELSFAGHPVLGAAAMMHAEFFGGVEVAAMQFVVHDRSIAVTTRRDSAGQEPHCAGQEPKCPGGHGWPRGTPGGQGGPRGAASYLAEMDQGVASIAAPVANARIDALLGALSLSRADLADGLPLQVISTGLAYLIVPVKANLERARIVAPDFEALLASIGAKFVYVLDVDRREGRTWDNDGRVEDIATGSAAGPAAAYLVAHGAASPDQVITLAQGRLVGRPSELHAIVRGGTEPGVTVRGRVCLVGDGKLVLPTPG